MNKNLIAFALVGLVVGFCLSAAAAPSKQENKEVAMSSCSKDNDQKKEGDNNGSGSCSSCNSQGDQSNASSQVKGKRKSAAHKVLYGK